MSLRVAYFHGFASSPAGRKVGALRALLEPDGFEIVAPDLNVPTFERLSWDAMVACAVACIEAAPTRVVVGSSLGALVALEATRRTPAPLVLVAPCLGFGPMWTPAFAQGDPVRFVDRDSGRERTIHRAFVEEFLRRHEHVAAPAAPVAVVMGRRDASIPFAQVRGEFDAWAASGALAPRSEFVDLPDGDHGLADFVDVIADAVRRRAGG